MPSHNSFSQSDWEKRALTKNYVLLEPVTVNYKKVKARCLRCEQETYVVPKDIHRSAGCPNCRLLLSKDKQSNEWQEFAKKLSFTWKGEVPSGVRDGSKEAICQLCGATWQVTPRNLYTKAGVGHPRCPKLPNKNSGKIRGAYKGGKSLQDAQPQLATQWHPRKNNGILPSEVSQGSKFVAWWLGVCGHEWPATVASRASGRGCPICAKKVIAPQINDLATTHPHLLATWDYQRNTLNPQELSWGSRKKVWWICEFGHPWEASPVKRVAGQGCPICAGNAVHVGINDLETLRPEIASTWDYQRNMRKSPSSTKVDAREKFWWMCDRRHSFRMSVDQRVKGGVCSVCNTPPKHPLNPISQSHPQLAREWHPSKNGGIGPENVSSGSHLRAWWICQFGHEWDAVIPSRARGNNCPICSNQRVVEGINDISITNPDLLASWDYELNVNVSPSSLSAGSTRVKVWWRCENGHPWRTTVPKRLEGQGCPTCSKGGFDPNSPGYLYFVWHELWQMFQIGITNYPEDRLARHRRNGFKLLEIRGPMDGHLTAAWETAILRFLKSQGADLGNSKIGGKFDGFSESWSKSTFVVDSLRSLMVQTEEYEVLEDSQN
jgi:hypothetical protein